MHPKQHEMDQIVKTIYRALEAQTHLRTTLLVLCGDHGMNDAGNHGGSSSGETSAALVFISPQFQTLSQGRPCPAKPTSPHRFYDLVKQLDIVPTLATLLGFPIPSNSLGVVIPQLLDMWPDPADRLVLVKRNVDQMIKVFSLSHGSNMVSDGTSSQCAADLDGDGVECLLDRAQRVEKDDQASIYDRIAAYLALLYNAQDTLSGAATEYNTGRLLIGLLSATMLVLSALATARFRPDISRSTVLWISIIMLSQALSMFSSSFIEEEHHVWHWLSTGWMAWLYMAASRRTTSPAHWFFVALMCLARIEKRWNQTGQKYAGGMDIGKTYLTDHPLILLGLTSLTYLGVFRQLGSRGLPFVSGCFNFTTHAAVVMAAIVFKLVFTGADAPELLPKPILTTLPTRHHLTLTALARVVFAGLVIISMVSTYRIASAGKKYARSRKST